jgi:hypothetical protein
MSSYRKVAIVTGILFLIATFFGAISLAFSGSLNSPDYLVDIYPGKASVIFGVLLVLIMGIAIVAIPIVLFPVLKKYDEISAIAYIVLRSLETGSYLVIIISRLLLVSLSVEFATSEALDLSAFLVVGGLLKNLESQITPVMTVFFSLGALVFYRVMYLSNLIPRFLAAWGFIGGMLTLAASILGIFELLSGNIVLIAILWVPIALNEIVLAVWLIVKGFHPLKTGTVTSP